MSGLRVGGYFIVRLISGGQFVGRMIAEEYSNRVFEIGPSMGIVSKYTSEISSMIPITNEEVTTINGKFTCTRQATLE